jgi:hypothetical protein
MNEDFMLPFLRKQRGSVSGYNLINWQYVASCLLSWEFFSQDIIEQRSLTKQELWFF